MRADILRSVLVASVALATIAGPASAQATWSAPVPISSAGDIGYVQFAANPRGDAIAVWGRLTGPENPPAVVPTYAIETAFRPAGGVWEPPVVVGTAHGVCDRGGCEHFPVVAVGIGTRGEAVAMWGSWVSGVLVTEMASRTAGGSWQRATAFGRGGGSGMQVALDRGGNATAIWIGGRTGQAVRVAFKPVGRPWRRPVTIGAGNGFGAQLALDARGDAIAVWCQTLSHHSGLLLRSAFRPAGGSWRRPVTIGRRQDLSVGPHIAVDPRGDAIAAWAGYERTNQCCATVVRSAFRPAGGRWRGQVTLERNNYTGGVQVALGKRGDATAVWYGSTGVRSASRPAGGLWAAAVTIATPSSRVDSLRVGLDPQGDGLAVWWVTPLPTVPSEVQAAMASPQGAWQPAVNLGGGASPLTAFDGSTGAALDSQGNAVVVWLADVGNGQQVVDAAKFQRSM
jgi:hypothetical protein